MSSRRFILLIISFLFLISCSSPATQTQKNTLPTASNTSASNNKQLKLETFKIPTPPPIPVAPPGEKPPPPPPPTAVCQPDSGGNNPNQCSCPPGEITVPNCMGYDYNVENNLCTISCWGKPVVYLYPKEPTLVSVFLNIPGRITVSDPFYPKDGWQNILALPNGTLHYQGKVYRELFYETEVNEVVQPITGIVVSTPLLKPVLTNLTHKLGLLPNEQQELLDYWLPKLKALNSPYIQVSVLSKEQKERVDQVIVTPNPQTKIEIFLYFKALASAHTIEPLIVPTTIPQREGFTMVEWGGTIDLH